MGRRKAITPQRLASLQDHNAWVAQRALQARQAELREEDEGEDDENVPGQAQGGGKKKKKKKKSKAKGGANGAIKADPNKTGSKVSEPLSCSSRRPSLVTLTTILI